MTQQVQDRSDTTRHAYVAKPDGTACGIKGYWFAWSPKYVTCEDCKEKMRAVVGSNNAS